MKLLVVKELKSGEKRVAVVPQVVSKLQALGFSVQIQAGAGEASLQSDELYQQAGAIVITDIDAALSQAECVVSVNPLTKEQIQKLLHNSLQEFPMGMYLLPLVFHKRKYNLALRVKTYLFHLYICM